MNQNLYIWEKEAFLGDSVLHSNSNRNHCRVVFAGAEKLDDTLQYKVNFIYNTHPISNSVNDRYSFPSSSNMVIIVTPGETIRFANHLGITEEVTVTYRPEEYSSCQRFFPISQMKFLEIKTDFLHYEVHCI
ncbi:MAG: hypothetical protein JJT76_11490 [Clostridiaceae bacterium]|nr:hypothetical protein [Clostridiaceae bacterium]